MPTINFSLKDLKKLTGKKISKDEFGKFLQYGKGEIDRIKGDEVIASFGDTNLPYLWSIEGVAKLIKNVSGKEKGISKINVRKSNYKIIVDSSLKEIRPCIASFVAKGRKIDDYLLKQMIQLQEKLSENYGRRRQKLAIGIYKSKQIQFPVHYKAVSPESMAFVPLDSTKSMTLSDILKNHPKGIEYSWILKEFKEYPLLTDSKNSVLSFPPVINSDKTGKVEINDNEIFFEATGTDEETTNLASCIFANALSERGFDIYGVEINYGSKKSTTPDFSTEIIKISKDDIKNIIGIEMSEKQIKQLAEKTGYEYSKGKFKISALRKDILHKVDVIEDIAMMYGYDNIKEEPLKDYTIGKTNKIVEFRDKARELAVGLGYQEVLSPVLNNKVNLYEKMNTKDFGTIEIEDYVSENLSCVRTWLIPILMEVLSKNKHVDYPQKIFEQGIVTERKGDEIKDYEKIALAFSDAHAGFTEMKQNLDFIMHNLGIKYDLQEIEHSSFIDGRAAKIISSGKKVGYIGEINPIVLERWNLKMPVAVMELNLSEMIGK